MNIEVVDTTSQPMLHVTRSASMDAAEIAGVMGEAFGMLSAFLGSNGIASTGAPLPVHRDWDGQTMQIDVGFPVSPSDAARADGDVKSGQSQVARLSRQCIAAPMQACGTHTRRWRPTSRRRD